MVRALERLRTRLGWLERAEADVRDDSAGEPAVFVRLVVRSGVQDLFEDGARLVEARGLVHSVLREAGVDLWPFVEFVSADELEAA